jgi:hypothetical protein
VAKNWCFIENIFETSIEKILFGFGGWMNELGEICLRDCLAQFKRSYPTIKVKKEISGWVVI